MEQWCSIGPSPCDFYIGFLCFVTEDADFKKKTNKGLFTVNSLNKALCDAKDKTFSLRQAAKQSCQ